MGSPVKPAWRDILLLVSSVDIMEEEEARWPARLVKDGKRVLGRWSHRNVVRGAASPRCVCGEVRFVGVATLLLGVAPSASQVRKFAVIRGSQRRLASFVGVALLNFFASLRRRFCFVPSLLRFSFILCATR
jgi:hypothetical protein